MNWEKLLNSSKLGNRIHADESRSPFNSDYDKIIFSGAFRRLAKKTQVHPLATNDHIHNRLTHSLEVSCVGRSLGSKVGEELKKKGNLPNNFYGRDIGDIVQAACLAHDIGNPPFGHTGEDAIGHWFRNDGKKYTLKLQASQRKDLENFEGNAQGLRILTSLEYHPGDGGMRLTYATLASFIKYPWTSPEPEEKRRKKNKYGVFQSELSIFDEIADSVGLEKLSINHYKRHPLVYLMEAADDFCYGLLDLEDGIEMGILEWSQVFEILKQALPKEKISDLKNEFDKFPNIKKRPPIARGKVMEAYINAATKTFIENEDNFMHGEPDDLISLCPEEIRESVDKAKSMAKDLVFNHPRKIELEIGSYNTISTLLEIMCEAAKSYSQDQKNQDYRSKRAIKLIGENVFKEGDDYHNLMCVIDFISGMTDNYATFLARQFNGMGEVR